MDLVFFLPPTGYKFTCFCRILSAFTLENNFKNFCRIRSSRSNPAKAISGHNYTTIFLKKCIISILWFSNFHKQHRFTKKLRNDSFNICVSCLNLILLFLSVDVVLEQKTFVLTEVQTHNPGHSTQCSEPSVIPSAIQAPQWDFGNQESTKSRVASFATLKFNALIG